jgi:enoyl-CoA hydratase
MSDEVVLDRHDRILVVTLNRPDQRNAVDTRLAEGLVAAMLELDADPDLRVGVLTGAGKGFFSGMDLKAFARNGAPAAFNRFLRAGAQKPLVAAVEGFALAGGLEIALTCDLIVAAAGARFGIPEVKVGLFAAGGALLRLPARLPHGVATRLALTGDHMLAEEAYAHGLVTEVAEPGAALDAALLLAGAISQNAPLSLATTKHLLGAARGLSDDVFWRAQAPFIDQVFGSSDAREGSAAFAERRLPTWTGA